MAMNDQVLIVPVTASEGLDELVKRRKEEVDEVKADLSILWSEARKMEQ